MTNHSLSDLILRLTSQRKCLSVPLVEMLFISIANYAVTAVALVGPLFFSAKIRAKCIQGQCSCCFCLLESGRA